MDYMDISRMRHTVRRFGPEPVPEEDISKILEAGRWAPTAVNAQPQRIVVIDTPEELAKVREFCTFGYDPKYAELSPEAADRENGRNVYYYGAPLVLLVCYDEDACWRHPETGRSSGETDATIVAVNMMMEAVSLGLGTAWISYFDPDKARRLLDLPDSWRTVCMLYVGKPAEGWKPNAHLSGARKPIEETCFRNGRRA
ncbi:MAG: nitroreductase family protein [Thermoplasmata archaeon]|nr:nitroreductase family protein [Thermoplasmata archaeon]